MQVPVFSILTRESVAPVRTIHDRMPVMLGKENLKEWIRPDGDPSSIAERALTNLVMEKAKENPDPEPDFMQICFMCIQLGKNYDSVIPQLSLSLTY